MFEEDIKTLQDHGPITEQDFTRLDGYPPQLIVENYLKELSGTVGFERVSYFHSVLERCGYHPEKAHCSERVAAFELARQLLVRGPQTRQALENLLATVQR